MSRSVDSTPGPHHVRRLLDHRINRLDPDDNFCGLTQYTDTPSVYSPTHFSPGQRRPNDGSYSPRDPLNDPNTSTLDLDDEPRFSIAVSHASHDHDDTHSFEEDDNEDGRRPSDEQDSRLSYLGPKMRFHSRAPWEMGADIQEEEESSFDSPKQHAFPFSFGGGGRASNSTGSSSPRASLGRPSADSVRSHIVPKRSFDTINSQMSSKGALYALAQESLSSASLARPPPQKDSLFGKLSSLGRARGNSSPSAPATHLPNRSHPSSRAPPQPHRNPLDHGPQFDYDPFAASQSLYVEHASRPQTPALEEAIHPYANPDLMTTTELSNRSTSYSTFLGPTSPDPDQRISSTTITQASVELTSSIPRNSLSSSIGGRNRTSSIHGREISSPVAVHSTSLPSDMSTPGLPGQAGGVNQLAGWKDNSAPPAFNLISLEEARALRAKPSAQPPADADDATPMQSAANLLSYSTSTLYTTDEPISGVNQDPSPTRRTRGRTISAGTKAKNAFHSIVGSVMTERRDTEPSVTPIQPTPASQLPKPLKHKKSGFMRLFNGIKDKDSDEAPPPVPSTSNGSDVASLNVKRVVSRVPVPSYSQPPSDSPQDGTFKLGSGSSSTSATKRGPPALSIDTVSSNHPGRDMQQQRTTSSLYAPKPWSGNDQPPASAPPDVTGFPALRLRPVSSLFSSGFEHIVPDLATSNFDAPTSSSPPGPMSPITPGKMERFPKQEPPAPTASQMVSSQRRVAQLEAQVRSLKVELEDLRTRQHDHAGPYCNACGRGRGASPGVREGSMSSNSSSSSGSGGIGYTSVIDRPRAKTSNTSRFVNALA